MFQTKDIINICPNWVDQQGAGEKLSLESRGDHEGEHSRRVYKKTQSFPLGSPKRPSNPEGAGLFPGSSAEIDPVLQPGFVEAW